VYTAAGNRTAPDCWSVCTWPESASYCPALPVTLALRGPAGWRLGWLLLGLLAVLALIPAAWAVRRVPEQAVRPHDADARVRLAPLAAVFVWYVLFGGGYVRSPRNINPDLYDDRLLHHSRGRDLLLPRCPTTGKRQ
jgi:hypothetical protein